MKLRLTKQQRAYQEQVLAGFDLADKFKPASNLVGCMAGHIQIIETECRRLELKLEAERRKSLWRCIVDRMSLGR
jgi:hypothetical protein